MQYRLGLPLLVLATLTGVEARRGDEDRDARPHSGHGHLNSNWAANSNLRLHLREQIKREEEHILKVQGAAAAQKPAWAIPENPAEDRLNAEECKEPKPYRKTDYAGAFGPEKIYCCHTVRQVIEDVHYRCEVECNDAHPCHKSMKEVYCPKYLAAYKQMEAVLCKVRPTTTTTTITTTTTTTVPICLDGEISPVYPCKCGPDGVCTGESDICDHATGSCSEYVMPHCPNGTHAEEYPCQCGSGENKNECKEGEVCTDWANGICEHVHNDTVIDGDAMSAMGWCHDMCVLRFADEINQAGIVEGPEECEKTTLQQQKLSEKTMKPACIAFCADLHQKGALRPEHEHGDHAAEAAETEA